MTRFWGIGFGLPNFFFYIDEMYFVEPALKIIKTLDINPHTFMYPSLYIYFQSLVSVIYYGLRGLSLGYPGIGEIPLHEFYFVGRSVGAAIGVATIYLVYRVGKELFDHKAGILSAAAMTGTFVHAVQSHYVKNDGLMILLELLSLYFCIKIMKGEGRRAYLLAGIFAGLSAATGYSGALFFIVPITALLLTNRGKADGDFHKGFSRGLFFIVLSALVGVFLGCPYCLLSPSEFSASPWYQRLSSPETLTSYDVLVHMGPLDGTPSWLWYIQYLWSSGLYYPLFLSSLGGLVLLLRPRRKNVFLLSFPLFYAVSLLVMGEVYRTDRLTLPLTPFLALFSGLFLSHILSFTSRPKTEKGRALLAVLLIAFFIALPIARVLLFDLSIAGPDTRELAEAWILQNVPQENMIFMWGGSPMLVGHRLRAGNYTNAINSLRFHDRMFQFPGELAVISESEFNIAKNYRNVEEYGDEYEHYEELFEKGQLLKEISNPFYKYEFFSPVSLEHSSTVNNYHNPTIQVYLLKEGPKVGSRAYRAEELKDFTEMELVQDGASRDGEALLTRTSQRMSIRGPYELIPRGNYTVIYRIKVENNTINETVARIDIRSSTGKIPLEMNLYGVNFTDNRYQDFAFYLSLPKADTLAFRLDVVGKTGVWLERIELSEPGRRR